MSGWGGGIEMVRSPFFCGRRGTAGAGRHCARRAPEVWPVTVGHAGRQGQREALPLVPGATAGAVARPIEPAPGLLLFQDGRQLRLLCADACERDAWCSALRAASRVSAGRLHEHDAGDDGHVDAVRAAGLHVWHCVQRL